LNRSHNGGEIKIFNVELFIRSCKAFSLQHFGNPQLAAVSDVCPGYSVVLENLLFKHQGRAFQSPLLQSLEGKVDDAGPELRASGKVFRERKVDEVMRAIGDKSEVMMNLKIPDGSLPEMREDTFASTDDTLTTERFGNARTFSYTPQE
jgi:hypothetical protein